MVRREDTQVAPAPGAQQPQQKRSSWEQVGRVDTVDTTNPKVDPNVRQPYPQPGQPMTQEQYQRQLQYQQQLAAQQAQQQQYNQQQLAQQAQIQAQMQALAMQERLREEQARRAEGNAGAQAAAQPQQQGRVIVLFGCRGGGGATTLAVNVAATLARAGKSVCIVDLDLQLGDVFVALDLEPTTSLASLAREADLIDPAALKRRLARHDSGLYALGQTGRIDDVDDSLAERLPTLLATLAGHFDVIVVDGVRDFGDFSLAALDMADRIGLVLTQDVPSVRRAARVCALFRKLGYSDRKISLIVNRHLQKSAVSEPEIERALALPVAARVRNDYARMRAALDEGALLHDIARGSTVLRDVEILAGVLYNDATPAPPPLEEKPGLVARILGRDK